jgi:NTE family protein
MLVLPQDIKDYGIAPEDLEVALAVRMSMSIPLFFKPVKLLNADHKTSYIVDGGLLSDYPVWLFDSSGPPEWPTFGFRLVQTGPPTVVRHDVHDPLSMLQALFGTATEAHDARYIATHDFARTIAIDTLHIGSTEFNLSPEQKEELYQSGVSAGQQFLAQWDFEQYKSLYRSGHPEPSRHEQALPKAPTVAVTSATAMTTATA